MSNRSLGLGLLAALACFGVGVGAARLLGPTARDPRPEPQILFDPNSIKLLPDASLRLDLPRGFDGGAP